MIWKPFIKNSLRVLKNISPKLVFSFLIVLQLSCSAPEPGPNILFFITLDTTRADHVLNEIEGINPAPHLQKLAENGTSFENCYSLIPITLPSHFSMFYSLPPSMTKIYNNGNKQTQRHPSMTEVLSRAGYYTAAVVSLGVLKRNFGLDKGFDIYSDAFDPGIWYKTAGEVNDELFPIIENAPQGDRFFWVHYSDPHEPYYPPQYKGRLSIRINGKSIYQSHSTKQPSIELELILKPGTNRLDIETRLPKAMAEHFDQNFRDIHLRSFSIDRREWGKDIGVTMPANWDRHVVAGREDFYFKDLNTRLHFENRSKSERKTTIRFIYHLRSSDKFRKQMYREEVSYMDAQIGELISFLRKKKLYRHSTFVVMGDHGEGLGEYKGHFGHIHYLNKVYSKVPLIISGKGIKKMTARSEFSSNLDIAPTILDILDIKRPAYMTGRSLLKTNRSKPFYLETHKPQSYFNSFSLIKSPYQLIYHPDKRGDEKFQLYNVISDKAGIHDLADQNISEMNRLKKRLIRYSKIVLSQKQLKRTISKEDEDILKSLGYL